MTDTARIASEEALIAEFLVPLAAGASGALGLADDCALLTPRAGHDLVLKTDAVAAGVHFFADDAPADIGWKALAVNVSDLAAKGAVPLGYLLSLAFPEPPTRSFMAALARGLGAAQSAFGMHLLGGDTDRRPGPLSLTPMVIGEVPSGAMIRRATTSPGDVLYISGTLGDAALGLVLRSDPGRAARWHLDAADADHLAARYLRPQPRLGLRTALRASARAAMDISDGLAKDLGRMCRAAGIGAEVAVSSLPLSKAARRVLAAEPDAMTAIVAHGDDYEVLAAVPAEQGSAYERAATAAGIAVTAIGRCIPGSGVRLLRDDGSPLALDRAGYDHF